MMRSRVVAAGLTSALALAVAGCSSEPEPTHNRVCVDPNTQIRVDDDECDDDRAGPGRFIWFYYPVHVGGVPVGSKINVSAGTYTKPAGPVGSIPRSGGFGTYRGTTGG